MNDTSVEDDQRVSGRRASGRCRLYLVLFVFAVLLGAGVSSLVWVAVTQNDESGMRVENTFSSTITFISDKSICVDRPDDSCGVAIQLNSEYQLEVGDEVEVTEVWLTWDSTELLAFYLRPAVSQ